MSQKDVDDAVAEELAAKAALEDTKAQLVKAQFDLDNTRITAPIAGLIERTGSMKGDWCPRRPICSRSSTRWTPCM